ncbi:hypothetical protein GOV13_00800 [Candidatus Pacearchaeota archaeon]|nr:hypothetical protein [Candidatus Pacearchaeota archaeon]
MNVWGMKDVALFDPWTFIHILGGIVLGTILFSILKNHEKTDRIKISILVILIMAYSWEATEMLIEIGFLGETLKHWFWGVEYLPNRIIIDPLATMGGFFLFLKKPNLGKISLFLYLIWWIVHIFIFPNAVYLQQII